jgi:hypothetical protein
LDILFIYISNVLPFPGFPSAIPHPILPYPASMSVLLQPPPPPRTYIHISTLVFLYIKPSQNQGPLLPLMPDKVPSAPSVLPLTPPLGSPCSVRFLTVSIHVCIGQDLTEPLRRRLYQAPVSKHFLASTVASEFGVCMWDGSPGGAVSGWPSLQYLLQSLSLYVL